MIEFAASTASLGSAGERPILCHPHAKPSCASSRLEHGLKLALGHPRSSDAPALAADLSVQDGNDFLQQDLDKRDPDLHKTKNSLMCQLLAQPPSIMKNVRSVYKSA